MLRVKRVRHDGGNHWRWLAFAIHGRVVWRLSVFCAVGIATGASATAVQFAHGYLYVGHDVMIRLRCVCVLLTRNFASYSWRKEIQSLDYMNPPATLISAPSVRPSVRRSFSVFLCCWRKGRRCWCEDSRNDRHTSTKLQRWFKPRNELTVKRESRPNRSASFWCIRHQ